MRKKDDHFEEGSLTYDPEKQQENDDNNTHMPSGVSKSRLDKQSSPDAMDQDLEDDTAIESDDYESACMQDANTSKDGAVQGSASKECAADSSFGAESSTSTQHSKTKKNLASAVNRNTWLQKPCSSSSRQPLCRRVLDMMNGSIIPIGKCILDSNVGCSSQGTVVENQFPLKTSLVFTDDDALRLLAKRIVRDFPSSQEKKKNAERLKKLLAMIHEEVLGF
jgi:hypothetical protein